MFCYQCEQTARGTGCATVGTCGKSPEVSDLQDLLVQVALAVAACRAKGAAGFLEEALFTTVTNVNFDAASVEAAIRRGAALIAEAGGSSPISATASRQEMLAAAATRSISARQRRLGADITGLQELLTYGL